MAKKVKNSVEKEKVAAENERSAMLDVAMATIKKECGVQIRDLSKAIVEDIPVISTGILSVDRAVKAFGLPRGKIIELFGPQASGKSALALMTAAEVQRSGGVVAWFDLENALDVDFATLLGVDVSKLLYVDDACAEDAIDAIIKLIETGCIDFIVIDSVANLVPKEELENGMDKQQMALQARVLSKGLRKLTAILGKSKTCVLFINQIRMRVGVMFGNPETTPGGKALPFYASVRIKVFMEKGCQIKIKEVVVGHKASVKVVKNRVGPPFGEGNFTILYESGFDRVADVCLVAKEEGIINAAGAWMSYISPKFTNADGGNEFKTQGLDPFIEGMKGRPDIVSEVRDAVILKAMADAKERRERIAAGGDINLASPFIVPVEVENSIQ